MTMKKSAKNLETKTLKSWVAANEGEYNRLAAKTGELTKTEDRFFREFENRKSELEKRK